MPASIAWNRKPLPQNAFAPLPLAAVRPHGWLIDRIREAPEGDLDERLLRAYLLGDAQAMRAVGAEMETVLSGGQVADYATLRALIHFHGATADRRVPPYLLRYAKELRDRLADGWQPLGVRKAADLGDLLYMALWLYNLTGQKALLELCRVLKAQAPDWMSTLHVFPMMKPVAQAPEIGDDAYWRLHGPTIAASLKTPAMQALFEGGLKNETAFSVGWDKLMRYHGAAHGLFNADPLLAGANPSRFVGAETVIELMRTLPLVLWAGGDARAGDLMERIAYTALPAARGGQAANQLAAGNGEAVAGFARFGASLWMAAHENGLAAVGYAPCEVRWRTQGQPVRIAVETEYPFEQTVTIRVRVKAPVSFPMHLRIPAWAEAAEAAVGDEMPEACAPGFHRIDRLWKDGDMVVLRLPMSVRAVCRYHQSVSVERGPLTFALPVEENTPWRQALVVDRGFELCSEEGLPVVYAYAAPLPEWGMVGTSPAPPPVAPRVSAETIRRIRLTPYATTDARIAQFPAAAVHAEGGGERK